MITLAIPFPMIDPVLVEIGPLAIRWYALAYMAGILLARRTIIISYLSIWNLQSCQMVIPT